MARPLKVAKLPPDIWEWLNAELIRRQFSNYSEIAQNLADRGYPISLSSIHRHGQRLRKQVDAFNGEEPVIPQHEPSPEVLAVALALARVEVHRARLQRRLSELLDHQQP